MSLRNFTGAQRDRNFNRERTAWASSDFSFRTGEAKFSERAIQSASFDATCKKKLRSFLQIAAGFGGGSALR